MLMVEGRNNINKLESADDILEAQQRLHNNNNSNPIIKSGNNHVLIINQRRELSNCNTRPSNQSSIHSSIIIIDKSNDKSSLDNKIKNASHTTRTCPSLTRTTTKLLTTFGANNSTNNAREPQPANTIANIDNIDGCRRQPSNKGEADNNKSLVGLERNSFESINSKLSISSINDDSTSTAATISKNLQQLLPTIVAADNRRTGDKQSSNNSNLLQHNRQTSLLDNNNNNNVALKNLINNDKDQPTVMMTIPTTNNNDINNTYKSNTSLTLKNKDNNSEKYEISPKKCPPGAQEGESDRQSLPPKVARASIISYNNQKPKPPFMFAGLLAGILGSLLFSFSLLCLKLLPEHEGFIGKMKALFFRGFFISLFCSIAIVLGKSTFKVPRDELTVNILRAVFGTTGVLGSYIALLYIGMGEATALIFSSPIWTSILGHFILDEPLHCSHFLAVPISLIGIVFIAHPGLIIDVNNISSLTSSSSPSSTTTTTTTMGLSNNSLQSAANASKEFYNRTHHQLAFNSGDQLIGFDVALSNTDPELLADSINDSFEHRWPGILTAILTSFFVSFSYITLKFRQKTPVQTTTFWFGLAMVAVALICLTITGFGQPPESLYEWSLYFGNGIFSWVGQSVFQWAFQYEEAGVLSILRTLDVATTFTLSALFLTEDIYWTSIVGAAIIGLVVVSMVLNNYIQQMSCMQPASVRSSKNSVLSKENLQQTKKI